MQLASLVDKYIVCKQETRLSHNFSRLPWRQA